jgi:hypothetical protein
MLARSSLAKQRYRTEVRREGKRLRYGSERPARGPGAGSTLTAGAVPGIERGTHLLIMSVRRNSHARISL